ncbi:MAG: dihydropteroate synthase [Methanomassiliicoccaceae archaeon]|nr:dihydropteroate synthase [Methanomassiliicoccaceae archaeon]
MTTPSTEWRRGLISYDRPRIMGVLNLTPDSFSDTIRYSGKAAVDRVFEMEDEGADIIDIGGESTRPGSLPVSPEEEIARIIDVIRIAAPSVNVPISVDTMHPETAEAALNAGAEMINDVSGIRDERMADLAASAGVPVVIMHMHGVPKTMQASTMSGDAVSRISEFFDAVCAYAELKGIKRNRIILDPGIGFGKTFQQNTEIIKGLRTFGRKFPILTGTSMKSFLPYAYPDLPRPDASILSAAECIRNGANIVRVHDVKRTLDALKDEKFE